MGRTQDTAPDPVLDRLHEVAERIRRRAAEGRAAAGRRVASPAPSGPRAPSAAQAPVPGQPAAPAIPRHWADGRDDDLDERTSH